MNDIPTPETDALVPTQGNKQTMLEYIETLEAHTCDLERRLTIEKNRADDMGKLAHANACEAMEYRRLLTIVRDALKKLNNWLMRDAQRKQIIAQALAQTTSGE